MLPSLRLLRLSTLTCDLGSESGLYMALGCGRQFLCAPEFHTLDTSEERWSCALPKASRVLTLPSQLAWVKTRREGQ